MAAAVSRERAERTTLALGEVIADASTGARFRITGFLGKGGMGEVYRGEAEGSGAVVAVKTIPLALADDPKIALRTRFESMALRALRHRNVVSVFGSGAREDGVFFMIMEYLPGATLLELRRATGRLPIPWALEIVRDACLGLAAIHDHAVHRDVKPANLHFGTDAIVRVLDLGAARWNRPGMRLTSTGTQVGTLPYMAPELLDESAPVGAAADIWSVGVVLYELLGDRFPFPAAAGLPDNPFLLGTRILDAPHVPLLDVAPLCSGSLAQIVDRTLAKDPRDRYGSAGELARVLSMEMESFARAYGAAPPLEALAAQVFPEAARRPIDARPGRAAGLRDGKHLQSTAPLDPKARPAQPQALPYLRTAEMPASVDETGREPPRVSDVFPKRPPLQETVRDLRAAAPAPPPRAPTPLTQPMAAQRERAPFARRAAMVGVGAVLLVAAGIAAVTLGTAGTAATPAASQAPRPAPAAR